MTIDESTMTEAEVMGFTKKVMAFSRSLSPAEQTLFNKVVAHAAGDSEADVQGYYATLAYHPLQTFYYTTFLDLYSTLPR